VWRPLLAIATLAGERWLEQARRAAAALCTRETSDEPSLGLLLLGDVRTVFAERSADRLATVDLIRSLAELEESPWGEWWIDARTDEPNQRGSRRFAQLLRPYGIRPTVLRIGSTTPRGYKREAFVDAWDRFLPGPRPDATSATRATSQPQSQANVADVADVADRREPSNGRFCDACLTPTVCSDLHLCRELKRLAAEHAAATARTD
jgi:hypothetical protein